MENVLDLQDIGVRVHELQDWEEISEMLVWNAFYFYWSAFRYYLWKKIGYI